VTILGAPQGAPITQDQKKMTDFKGFDDYEPAAAPSTNRGHRAAVPPRPMSPASISQNDGRAPRRIVRFCDFALIS
jgi:hypothetical protein